MQRKRGNRKKKKTNGKTGGVGVKLTVRCGGAGRAHTMTGLCDHSWKWVPSSSGASGNTAEFKFKGTEKCIHGQHQLKRSLRDNIGSSSVVNPWVCWGRETRGKRSVGFPKGVLTPGLRNRVCQPSDALVVVGGGWSL